MDFVDSLKAIFDEVCAFLDKEILLGNQNEEIKSKAMSLMTRVVNMRNRSVLQLADTNGYADMNKKPAVDEYIDADAKPQDSVYSSADEVVCEEECGSKSKLECPYKNALINQLNPVKSGTLYRRESFFIFRPNRMYFVVLLDDWLLFYNSNKKTQAQEVYPLMNVKAVNTDDKTGTFGLNVDDKSFVMTADSRKEKLQWISAIEDIANFKTTLVEAVESSVNEDKIQTHRNKHTSIESNDSNVYADIDEHQKYFLLGSTSFGGGDPPPAKRMLPAIPVQYANHVSVNNNQNGVDLTVAPSAAPPRASAAAIPPPDDDEIYHYVSAKPEYSNGHDCHDNNPSTTTQTPPTPPDPEEIYQFVAVPVAEQCQTLQEDTGYPSGEEIYSNIDETPPVSRDDEVTMRHRDSQKPQLPEKPAKLTSVPPSPKQMMIKEMRLKQKLKNSIIGERGKKTSSTK